MTQPIALNRLRFLKYYDVPRNSNDSQAFCNTYNIIDNRQLSDWQAAAAWKTRTQHIRRISCRFPVPHSGIIIIVRSYYDYKSHDGISNDCVVVDVAASAAVAAVLSRRTTINHGR